MYYGGGNQTTVNNNSKPLPFDFVTGSVKGRTDGFTIKVSASTFALYFLHHCSGFPSLLMTKPALSFAV